MRINRRACEELASLPADQTRHRPEFWDDTLPGFGVRVSASGRLSFVVKFFLRGDPKQRRVTLGEFPALKPEKARDEASAIKDAAKLGRDLLGERRAALDAAEAERVAARALALPVADLLAGWRERAEGEEKNPPYGG